MQKIRGLLREAAGIERRGFQEWRCGVGGGLGARYGCGLFAKLRKGKAREVWCQCIRYVAFFFFFDFQGQTNGAINSRGKKMGREKENQGSSYVRWLLALFSIGQGTADIQGALHENSLFFPVLFLVWRVSIPSWPVRSSRQSFEKRK